MPFRIQPLNHDDIPEIIAIERDSFSPPWPATAYRRELENRIANYFVLREVEAPAGSPGFPSGRWLDVGATPPAPKQPEPILGYAGIWVVLDEAQLTTIAVRRDERGRGLADYLMVYALECAADRGAEYMTLEVRESNASAQRLYEKFGFQVDGRRKNYYTGPREDALSMSCRGINRADYRQSLREHRRSMIARAGRPRIAS